MTNLSNLKIFLTWVISLRIFATSFLRTTGKLCYSHQVHVLKATCAAAVSLGSVSVFLFGNRLSMQFVVESGWILQKVAACLQCSRPWVLSVLLHRNCFGRLQHLSALLRLRLRLCLMNWWLYSSYIRPHPLIQFCSATLHHFLLLLTLLMNPRAKELTNWILGSLITPVSLSLLHDTRLLATVSFSFKLVWLHALLHHVHNISTILLKAYLLWLDFSTLSWVGRLASGHWGAWGLVLFELDWLLIIILTLRTH